MLMHCWCTFFDSVLLQHSASTKDLASTELINVCTMVTIYTKTVFTSSIEVVSTFICNIHLLYYFLWALLKGKNYQCKHLREKGRKDIIRYGFNFQPVLKIASYKKQNEPIK